MYYVSAKFVLKTIRQVEFKSSENSYLVSKTVPKLLQFKTFTTSKNIKDSIIPPKA